MTPVQNQEFVTPESLLLDTAERLGRVRSGRIALRVYMSRLSSAYSDPAYIRIAVRMFDGLVANYRCQIFVMTNGDIVATGKDMPYAEVDAAVYKLRMLFEADPLVHEAPYAPDDPFCSWYDLETEFDAFYEMARQSREATPSNTADRHKHPTQRPITPADLEPLSAALNDATVRPFISQQAAVHVTPLGDSSLAFQEIYVSIQALMQRMAPGTDLLSDRWLFQYLSANLDRRVLSCVDNLTLYGRELPLNLNLNISTVLSPSFTQFVNKFDHLNLCVEFQPIDVFANPTQFLKACAVLHDLGHKTLIDGLSPLSLWMLADSGLPVDAFKLMWTADLHRGHHGAADRDPKNAIKVLGPSRIILGHCDSFAALEWGLKIGIRTYQGYFVDESLIGQSNTLQLAPSSRKGDKS